MTVIDWPQAALSKAWDTATKSNLGAITGMLAGIPDDFGRSPVMIEVAALSKAWGIIGAGLGDRATRSDVRLTPAEIRRVRQLLVLFVFSYVFCVSTLIYLENREVLDIFATIFDGSPLAIAFYAAKETGKAFDKLSKRG